MAVHRAVDPEKTRAAVAAVADWLRDEHAEAPPRPQVAEAVRSTARTLASVAPGASVEVRVPLFGGKIEEIIAGQVRRLLEAETAFTVRWLGSH